MFSYQCVYRIIWNLQSESWTKIHSKPKSVVLGEWGFFCFFLVKCTILILKYLFILFWIVLIACVFLVNGLFAYLCIIQLYCAFLVKNMWLTAQFTSKICQNYWCPYIGCFLHWCLRFSSQMMPEITGIYS